MVKSGGWIGSVYVLYASLTEYLVFTGTAIDSEGHSGEQTIFKLFKAMLMLYLWV